MRGSEPVLMNVELTRIDEYEIVEYVYNGVKLVFL
jgi:hypothetical protein